MNIQKILIELESPNSNEHKEELNKKIEKYLKKVSEPLNLSLWESVTYEYWSFNNLTKLLGKKFDEEHGSRLNIFKEKIREIQKFRLDKESPKIPVKLEKINNLLHLNSSNTTSIDKHVENNKQSEIKNEYSIIKILGFTCLAVAGTWVTFNLWKSAKSQ